MTSTRTAFSLLPEPAPADVRVGIISVDDHVIEPPDTFAGRLPGKYRDREPRVVEAERVTTSLAENFRKWDPDQSPIARGIVDFTSPRQAWSIDGRLFPIYGMDSCVGRPSAEWCMQPLRFDEMRPGSWNIDARVRDMDQSGIIASVNFPSLWPGFCGASLSVFDDVDFTAGQTLAEFAAQLAERQVVFAVAHAQPAVRSELDRFGVTAAIGPDHVYATLDEAIAAFRAS